jgi:glycosyltransferase involved in cell wall biosynthesis
VVRNPETEVDPIFKSCRATGEPCLFLSFASPNTIPLDLECPTVPVIAWEFSTIPDGGWDENTRNDWRFVLGKIGRAIALSGHSARVIAEEMGPQFPIAAVPVPIQNRAADAFPAEPVSAGFRIRSQGTILDTATMKLDVNVLAPAAPRPGGDSVGCGGDDQRLMRRGLISGSAFFERIVEIIRGLGGQQPELERGEEGEVKAGEVVQSHVRLSAGGVVYTAVVNPGDRHKNLSDLVTAFCWAFRDIADATLVLKVGDNGLQAFYSTIIPVLYRLSPFQCRVLVLPGFLADDEYDQLIRATTYYVNGSNAEGLCMPLMEFMTCGKPAIAPAHTAMADYIDNDVAFVLRASRQIAAWPDDPRQLYRTMCYRLDWGSLLEAYRQSYRLATTAPGDYREMSKRARARLEGYASSTIVKGQLRDFFSSSLGDATTD